MGIVLSLKGLYGTVERRAGWLFAAGGAAAVLWNLRQWRRDRHRLRQLAGQEPDTDHFHETPRVSILLPAWNEASCLGPCIESILNLRYPDIELIICAGGDDDSLDIARSYEGPCVIVLEQHPGEGKQGALRRCFAHSTGPIIYLTDADCILDDTCFEGTLRPLLAENADAATGSWRPLDRQQDQPFVQYQWSHHVYREMWMPDYVPALDGRNTAVKRTMLEKANAFEIEAFIGTDLALSRQLEAAGCAIRFVRGSHVQTEYPETVTCYRRQQSRWFRNPLVHENRWLTSSLARSHLWAGLAATFLVVTPLPAIFSRALRSAWIGSVLHLFLTQLRVQRALQDMIGEQGSPLQLLRACGYLPLGWAVMSESLWSLLCCPKKRGQW